jgi:hypothetical protein
MEKVNAFAASAYATKTRAILAARARTVQLVETVKIFLIL